jgi:hypothetical protein
LLVDGELACDELQPAASSARSAAAPRPNVRGRVPRVRRSVMCRSVLLDGFFASSLTVRIAA